MSCECRELTQGLSESKRCDKCGMFLPRGKIIKNAFGAIGRIAVATALRRRVGVSTEEQERRLAICRVCEFYRANKCMKCGCVARWKTKLATEHCPDIPPRW